MQDHVKELSSLPGAVTVKDGGQVFGTDGEVLEEVERLFQIQCSTAPTGPGLLER